MVRNYIRKTEKPSYTEDDVQNAVEKIRTKEWTYETASNLTNIPIGTLASRISRKSNQQVGRPTALRKTEEKHLVDLIITLQDYGELSTSDDVLKYATEFVHIMNLKSRFKNGEPTRDWYYGFIARWKDKLKIMNSSKIEKVRADVTMSTIDDWFAKLHSVLSKLDLFNKPQQLFNCDESGFRDDPGKKKVVVSRQTKFANKIHTGSGKENTTVLLTINASGVCLPPYIIHKSKCLYDIWCPRNVIRGAIYNRTESGWINEDTFFDYLKNMFIPQTKHIPRPILLIFDGHTSHLSLKTAQLAIDNQIHLLCLPAHATHLLQPLDVYTLKYVKTQWRTLLWDYYNKNAGKKLDKPTFIRLYAQLYNYALLPTHCSSAFGKAGIFPYDPRVIKRDKIIKTSSSSTAPNSLSRSKSVEFDYNVIETTTTTSSPALHSNRNRQLVKHPSDPVLFSGYDETNKEKSRTSSNSYQNIITSLDNALRATDSVILPSSNTSIQSTTTNLFSSNNFDMSTSNTNHNSIALSTSTIDTSLVSSTSNTNDSSFVLSQSIEKDRTLGAIEMIVKKHFSQVSTTRPARKKRLIHGANGRCVTDLDELALTAIKKKKTTETKLTKNCSNKTTVTQKQNVPSTTDICNANRINTNNSTNTAPIGTQNVSLPPISYMLPSNTSSLVPTFQSNPASYVPLYNTSSTSIQCHLCYNYIKPAEMTSNCNLCHGILCWECSSTMDNSYQLCQLCRAYFTGQQQNYFAYKQ
ncbi:unnamed protein product [Rotaria sp. Silwood1]|nr:unnamed protein product [Rotaria sp. Silwood1]CAF1587611.1 unnamed protein product [Rotaria sp. Silwood1]CAF3679734.1 unnamed protein product [Rotaria sp. Silwood1]CAF3722029.1 unnamed protein product [Rotaria sp. Silwood1]CAF4967059.1 unnamed protein product [Rotaria sp. Silwood1]